MRFPAEPQLRDARQLLDAGDATRADYDAYRSQWHSSKKRGIPFRLTFLEWRAWWQQQLAAIGPDAQRGNRLGQFMMARDGDAGAYELGNIHIASPRGNISEISQDRRAAGLAKRTARLVERKLATV